MSTCSRDWKECNSLHLLCSPHHGRHRAPLSTAEPLASPLPGCSDAYMSLGAIPGQDPSPAVSLDVASLLESGRAFNSMEMVCCRPWGHSSTEPCWACLIYWCVVALMPSSCAFLCPHSMGSRAALCDFTSNSEENLQELGKRQDKTVGVLGRW